MRNRVIVKNVVCRSAQCGSSVNVGVGATLAKDVKIGDKVDIGVMAVVSSAQGA